MAISINTNNSTLNAQRSLATQGAGLERLSSGMRINSAADDKAGLAIASRLPSSDRVTLSSDSPREISPVYSRPQINVDAVATSRVSDIELEPFSRATLDIGSAGEEIARQTQQLNSLTQGVMTTLRG